METKAFYRWIQWVYYVLVMISMLLHRVHGNTMVVISQPTTITAGDSLNPPPVVQLIDDTGQVLSSISVGFVTVSIGINPPVFGQLSGTNGITFPFLNGIAMCTGLSINLIGNGYTLIFASLFHGLQTESSPFDILLGPPYKLSMYTYIGVATGGTPFLPQPIVSIVDRGGNIVDSINQGTVSVAILNNPVGGILTPTTSYTVWIYQGLGKFFALKIDKAGGPYTLRFTADNAILLPGGRTFDTFPFTVAIGPPNKMIVTEHPTAAFGGDAFAIQPTITLIDAGLNTLATQINMQVVATIYSNPSKGKLYPVDETRANIYDGIASFKNLRIDAAGNNYQLRYAVKTPNARGIYVETGLFVLGPSFNVYIGSLFSLAVVRPPMSAIADGQPIYKQPIIDLKDKGGNTIDTENLAVVTVSMLPSLSIYNTLIISTANPITATILSVVLLPSVFTSPFGSGTDLILSVSFSQDVIATGDVQIMLNSGVGATAKCTTLLTWSRTLQFTYGITAGHSATALNYLATTSLVLVAGTIKDRLGNAVTLTLPDPSTSGITPVVAVDTTAPSIVSFGCGGSTVAGMYGPGQDLFLSVSFSAPVVVLGTPPAAVPIPFIPLNLQIVRTVPYVSGNGTSVLVFKYTVGLTDILTGALLDTPTTINLNGAALRRAGTTPNQAASIQMPSNILMTLPNICPIQIDTSTVVVDTAVGVKSTSPNQVYTPGDVVSITVPFTKAVIVTGIPLLYLNTMRNSVYVSGSGTKILVFQYTVGAGDITNGLNYATDTSLVLNGGSMRQYVTAGTAISDVNPSLAATTTAGKSLSSQSSIQIDGTTPTIQSVSFASAGTKTRGDTVQMSLLFSSNVVVDGGVPSILLNTNRKALYTSGSGTTSLVFSYQVLLGDTTSQLEYIAVAGLSLNGAKILKMSSNPTLSADVSLPWPPNILNGPVVIDPNLPFVSSVTGIVANLPAGEYGLNQAVEITVSFSDKVQVIGIIQLQLQTQAIQYASGSGTSQLAFLYVVKQNDAAISLNIASTTPFICQGQSACSIVNGNLVPVNLDCTGITLQPSGMVINTDEPRVVSVSSLTTVPSINSNTFVVGDIIDILMVVSKQVHVEPSPDVFPDKVPLLALSTGRSGATASFLRYGIDRTQLVFRYIVQKGDSTQSLTYVDTNSLSLNFNQATIKRLSSNPITDMILTLPQVQPLGIGLKIDTSRVPYVTNVVATTPDGTYYCGDLITIQVSFSEYIVVTGQPVLKLDLGAVDEDAVYTSGSGSQVLTFTYTVRQNDKTRDLSYIDLKSLYIPDGSSILHQSSIPTVRANTRLPSTGQTGSLSANNNIVIRGETPYISDISFVTLNGTYTVNNVIQIKVTFTATVTVTGSPYLEMLTGTVFRRAAYIPGAPSAILIFQYRVEIGDISSKLDYSATNALRLNGGTIMTTPTQLNRTPIQPANTQLNPPGGALSGVRTIQTSLGRASFIDLGIDTMGLRYVFYFSTPPGVSVSVQFDVTYSAVWEVRNSPIDILNRGDKSGWSVDINGPVAIVGSSGTKAKQYNVQEITAWGTSMVFVDEVQYVQTTCVHRDAIQILVSSVAPGEVVGGYFSLMLGAIGPSRRIMADFDAVQLQTAIQLDFGLDPETLSVSRDTNVYCGCQNAYRWTITFRTQGDVPTLVARSYLTGNGATIGDGVGGTAAIVINEPPIVSGQFALRYGNLITQNMPSNVDASTMATRLALDLKLPIRSVARSAPTSQYGYTWSITFSSSDTVFNINQLQPAPVLLTGNQVLLSVNTVREGQAPLYGSFRLSLGAESTGNIGVNANTATMKAALETLSQVTTVNVARSQQNPYGGYTWTVTFLEINTPSIYGLILNNLGTLPPLTPITLVNNLPLLFGSDATVHVNYAGVNPSVNSGAARGNTPGHSAGSASIFIPYNKQWILSAYLIGTDTRLGDQFGTSVALSQSGSQAVVGAPFAVNNGVKEQQGLSCVADGGTFKLVFRGVPSTSIPFNASPAALQAAIAELLQVPIGLIQISTYSNLCNGAAITITLVTPDLADPTGDVPDLIPDPTLLTNGAGIGTVSVQQVVQGTFRQDGPQAKGVTCGGAYFFSSASVGQWTQNLKVIPTQGAESMSSEFGTSVAIDGAFAVVGAPGAWSSQGEVYVYQYSGATWTLYQKLTIAPYISTQGDRFGQVVRISSTTIVVGAPGYASTAGASFVFQLVNGVFVNRQKLQPGDLKIGDYFGSSLSLDMRTSTIVVSSKNHDQHGAVYVYYSPDLLFSLQQILLASDIRHDDGFGQSVTIVNNVLLVGANERYNSNRLLTIRKAVQTITTSASTLMTGTFRVGFRKYADQYEEDFIFSRGIPFDASSTLMKIILEADLDTNPLVVTRLGPDVNGGYSWSITFAGSNADVPKFEVDGSSLKGTNTRITCTLDIPVPPIVRSNVYVFLRSGSVWTEQATLHPTNKQYFSMFGNALAMSRNGYHAIVGAFNADTLFSAVNSGAAYVFDMGFLDFRFSNPIYSVLEGSSVTINVQRCGQLGNACIMKTTTTLEYVDYDTGDAIVDMAGLNRVASMELKFIGPFQQLCMLDVDANTPGAKFYPEILGPEPYPLVPKGRYLLTSMVGTACSRSQSYGSTEYRSAWIDSQFDYSGMSDYIPSNGELSFAPQTIAASFIVSTTDDKVFEYPDEVINVRLSVPGMWPSYPSQLWSKITILDNGDGGFGAASYSTRLSGSVLRGSRMGTSVAYFDSLNLAVVGAPSAKIGDIPCGTVFVFKSISGVWTLEATITPSTCTPDLAFGTSVAIDGSYGTVRLVIGSPGPPTPSARVYRRSTSAVWSHEITFTHPNAMSTTDNYAGQRAVGIHGNLVVVGASGLEAIFVYTVTPTGWLPSIQLRASDYAVDQVNLQSITHIFKFGAAVAIKRRSILVGAPEANYGPNRVFDSVYFSTGAAYIFYLPAQVQVISLRSDSLLTSGEFTISNGVITTSPLIYQISASDLATVLKALIPDVEVSRSGDIVSGFSWSVTYISEVVNQPLLIPGWRGNGCTICIEFSSGFTADPTQQVRVVQQTSLGSWTFQTRVTASDANHADKFGHSVALDGNAAVIGAYTSSAHTSTTWNFETGDLTGWVKTGTAFDFQPTFGDNVMARGNLYKNFEMAKGTIGHEGRYWIGTFESRPGAGINQRQTPYTCSFANDDCKTTQHILPGAAIAGSIQGDGPRGTLSSQTFTIVGSSIQFRIGGGCDRASIYVELLVDGLSVIRTTGRCDERMRIAKWNVTKYRSKSAMVRIVDASSNTLWGHINVDDFRFDWAVEQVTTGNAGVAYTFQRQATSGTFTPCSNIPKVQCAWVLQARLVSSDKRTGDQFGFSVGIDDTSGTVAIGAYGQPGVNANNTMINMQKTGSIYLFSRIDAIKDGAGNILSPPKWLGKESAKFQSSDKSSSSLWGYSLAFSGSRLAVGSPGYMENSGCGYVYDTRFLQVQFANSEVGVVENVVGGQVIVVVTRTGDLSGPLTIGYATSDQSAVGIDSGWFTSCLAMMLPTRTRCGDYLQTSGELTFSVGESNKVIAVSIMDDLCYEPYPEYIAVQLNILGGDVLLGEQFSMRIRIDDDDFGRDTC